MTTPPRPKRYAPLALSLSKGQSLPPATPTDMPGLPSDTKLVTGEHRGGHRPLSNQQQGEPWRAPPDSGGLLARPRAKNQFDTYFP